MPESRVEHARRLRQSVIGFCVEAFRKEYVEAHGREFPGIEPPAHPVPDRPWQTFMEVLVFGGGWRPRGAVVEAFLERQRDLPRRDQALLRSWMDPPDGFFRLVRKDGKLWAFSLLSEAEYRLAVETGGDVPENTLLSCILYSVGGGDYVPGGAKGLAPDKADETLGYLLTSLGVQMIAPPRAFRDNPVRLERSRAIAATRRAFFFETFKGDEVRGTGAAVTAEYRRFRALWLQREPSPVLYPDMAVDAVQQRFEQLNSAAMILDGRGEMFLVPEWEPFLEACRTGAENEALRKPFALYLVNAIAMVSLWDRAIRMHPQTIRQALARVIEPGQVEEFVSQIPGIVEARAKFPPCVALLDPQLAGALPGFLKEIEERHRKGEEETTEKEGPRLWGPGQT
jgi:hypothetical protein